MASSALLAWPGTQGACGTCGLAACTTLGKASCSMLCVLLALLASVDCALVTSRSTRAWLELLEQLREVLDPAVWWEARKEAALFDPWLRCS